MTTNRLWTIGASALTAVVLIAGWLLGISPNLAQVAANDSARADAQSQNQVQASTLAQLKSEFAGLGEFKTKLDAERTAVPSEVEMSDFVRELDALQQVTGATVVNITPGTALAYAPGSVTPTEEVAPTDNVETESGEAATPIATDTAASSAATAPVAAPIVGAELVSGSNFSLLPMSIQVTGTFEQVAAYLHAVQMGDRLFVPSGYDISLDETSTTFSLAMEGYVYVLSDDAVATESVAAPGDASTATVN